MTETATPAPAPAKDSSGILMRGALMLVFLVLTTLARYITILIALIQFGWMLATGGPNPHVRSFGAALADWMADATRFLSAASDEKPFPWKNWPGAK
jgi:hypothetical protein